MAAWPLSENTSRKDNVQAHRFAGAPAHLQIVGILNGLFVWVRASSGIAAVGVDAVTFACGTVHIDGQRASVDRGDGNAVLIGIDAVIA